MIEMLEKSEVEDIELTLLLEGVKLRYGYDFQGYTRAHIKRRVIHRLEESKISSITELLGVILYDRKFFDQFLLDFSINVTEMFRDPTFYQSIRINVIPYLSTYPYLKVWHAGCSSGEEVYSMGILFKEESLFNRVTQYATDFNEKILKVAKEAIYPISKIKSYSRNYQQAGGAESLSNYYTAAYESIKLKKQITEKVVFSDHNLVTDGVFGEMNMIVCRNVMIYFDVELQNRVFQLFYESLCHGGILCLGSKESIHFSSIEDKFVAIDERERIFKKIG